MRVTALFVLAAASPLAAQSFSCATQTAAPAAVRARGYQELLAPVTVQCSGTRPAGGITGSISMSLNVPVSSRLLSAENNASEALLVIDAPAPGAQVGQPAAESFVPNANVIQGFVIGGNIVWQNLPVAPPGTPGPFSRTFTIVNVRANVSQLNVSSNVVMTLNMLTNPFVPLANPSLTAGVVADTNAFSFRTPDDTAPFTGFIDACFGNKFPVDALTQRDFNIKFFESSSTEYRKRNVATSALNPGAVSNQNQPGVNYQTETGFYNANFPALSRMNVAGLATHGTRLMARLSGIPAGVDVYVTYQPVTEGTSATGITARLASTDANGGGNFGAAAPTVGPYTRLTVTNGTATAVWEVLESNPEVLETLSFGVLFSIAANSPADANIRVQGGLVPFGTGAPPFTDVTNPTFGPHRAAVDVTVIRSCAGALTVTTPCPLPAASLNLPYNLNLGASGGVPPYRWELLTGALPGGLVLTQTGSVTGTPVTEGVFNFTLVLRDSTLATVLRECSMQVVPTLTITTACPLPDATVGAPYSALLSAQGGRPPYQWTAPLANLPPGLAISATGVISNVPTLAGVFDFPLRVTDATGASAERECRIRVNGPFRVQPDSLTFEGFASGPATPPQLLYVTSASPGQGFSLRVTTGDGQPWLRATPASGAAPGAVQVTADPRGLPPGVYAGTVTVAALNFGQQAQSVAVTFRVSVSSEPQMLVEPSGVTVAVPRNSGAVRRNLLVLNRGNGQISYTASAAALNGSGWIAVSPASGNVTPDAPGRVSVTINTQALEPGAHRARVTLNSPATGGTVEVPVTVVVSGSREAMSVSQTGLTFVGVAGGPNPPVQNVLVSSAGAGGFTWEATATSEDASLNWLALSSAAGSSTPGSPSPLGVRVNTTGLPAGTYFGEVRVRAAGVDNSPRTVQVVLRVLAASANPGVRLTPAGLTFVARQGDVSVPAQTMQVHNPLPSAQAFDFSFPQENRVFTAAAPDGTALTPGTPGRIQVGVTLAGLGPGVYRAPLSVAAGNDPRVQTADVVLVVLPGVAAALAQTPGEARGDYICSAGGGLAVNPVSHAGGFQATAGHPAAIEALVTDRSGNPLVSGAVTMLPSAEDMAAVPLQHQGGGRWTATWIPAPAGGGPVTLNFFADDADRGLSGCAQLHGQVEGNANAPLLTQRGIVSNASFRAWDPIAPGSMLAVFGQKLAGAPAQAQSFPLPFQLGTTRVSIAGVGAPLIYAGETNNLSQVNLIAPYNLPLHVSVPVVVRTGGGVAVAETITAEAAPGVFSADQSGGGQGIVVLGSSPSVIAGPNNPAARGEVVIIYAAGLGLTQPGVNASEAAPSNPLARVAREVTVTIGGQEAAVSFAGLTPGFSGLYQLNVTVPAGAPVGSAVPVVVSVAGASSAVTTMAVR
jgi:uncharacterized protein (TIGR03437 family)